MSSELEAVLLEVSLAIRLVLASILLYAALAKLRRGDAVAIVAQYSVLPGRMAVAVGYLLPWGELAIGLGLLWPPTTWIAAIGSVVVFVAFSWAVGVNLTAHRSPPCGCFGDGRAISPDTLRRLALLLGGAITVLAIQTVAQRNLAWTWQSLVASLVLALLLGSFGSLLLRAASVASLVGAITVHHKPRS